MPLNKETIPNQTSVMKGNPRGVVVHVLDERTEKTMEHESDGDTNCNWCTLYSHQRIGKGTEELGNNRTIRNHPDYSIIKIDQNTEESPGDLKRLAKLSTLLFRLTTE